MSEKNKIRLRFWASDMENLCPDGINTGSNKCKECPHFIDKDVNEKKDECGKPILNNEGKPIFFGMVACKNMKE